MKIKHVDLSGKVCPELTGIVWLLVKAMNEGDCLLATITYGLAPIDLVHELRDVAEVEVRSNGKVYLFSFTKSARPKASRSAASR